MSQQKPLIFICTRAPQNAEKRLAHRIALYLEENGTGQIGSIQMLGQHLSLDRGQRRKMIFINDCNSNCVKVLTNGLGSNEYIYIDVSKERNTGAFDIDAFFKDRITAELQQINADPGREA